MSKASKGHFLVHYFMELGVKVKLWTFDGLSFFGPVDGIKRA